MFKPSWTLVMVSMAALIQVWSEVLNTGISRRIVIYFEAWDLTSISLASRLIGLHPYGHLQHLIWLFKRTYYASPFAWPS